MSLRITNKATAAQLRILTELEYTGSGKYAADKLTVEEASKLIEELFTEQKYTTGMIREIAADYYHMPIVEVAGSSPDDIDDPFNTINKENK